jgi:hypothetical protein
MWSPVGSATQSKPNKGEGTIMRRILMLAALTVLAFVMTTPGGEPPQRNAPSPPGT